MWYQWVNGKHIQTCVYILFSWPLVWWSEYWLLPCWFYLNSSIYVMWILVVASWLVEVGGLSILLGMIPQYETPRKNNDLAGDLHKSAGRTRGNSWIRTTWNSSFFFLGGGGKLLLPWPEGTGSFLATKLVWPLNDSRGSFLGTEWVYGTFSSHYISLRAPIWVYGKLSGH